MNRCHIAIAVSVGALTLGGCSSQISSQNYADAVRLGALGPAVSSPRAGEFHLGAGDQLGEAVFDLYVAHARLKGDQWPAYASVATAIDEPLPRMPR